MKKQKVMILKKNQIERSVAIFKDIFKNENIKLDQLFEATDVPPFLSHILRIYIRIYMIVP